MPSSALLQRREAERKPQSSTADESSDEIAQSRELSGSYRSAPIVRMPPLMQTKLTVGTPGDRYEREADTVADRVVEGKPAAPISSIPAGGLGAQRSPDEADEDAQAKCSACESTEAPVQRREEPAPAIQPAPTQAADVQAKCAECDTEKPSPEKREQVQRQADDESADDAEAEEGEELAGATATEEGESDARDAQPGDQVQPATNKDDGDAGDDGGPEPESEDAQPAKDDLGCGDDGGDNEKDDAGGAKKGCGGEAAAPAAAEPEGDSAGGATPDAGPEAAPAPQGEEAETGQAANGNCGPQAATPAAPAKGETEEGEEPEEPDVPDSDEAAQLMSEEDAAQTVQLACNQCESEKTAQRKEKPAKKEPARPAMQTDVAARHLHARGPGEPLPATVKGRMESSMGVDLSPVRVHTDGNAQAASKALKAKAFTHKQHIFLGAGQSKHDVGLMAHETTHAVQQGAVARKPPEAAEAKKGIDAQLPGDARKPADGKAPAEALTPGDKAKTQIKLPSAEKAPAPRHAAPAISLGKPKPASMEMEATKAKPPEHVPVDASKKSDTPEHSEKPPVLPMAPKPEAPPPKSKAAAPSPASPLAAAGKAAPTEAAAPPKAGARASAAPGAPETVAADSEPAAEKAAKNDPESDARFQGTIRRLHATAHRERDHVPPQDKVDEAKAAVKAPAEEPQSHAANDNVAAMAAGAEAAPVPKEKSFEDTLNEKLEDIRPKNMEQTLEFKGSGSAGKLKQAVGKEIKAQKNTTVGPLEKATVAPLPVGKYPNPQEKKLEPEPADPAMRSLHAESVLPEAKPEEAVSVDKDKDEADRLMKENDLDEDQLKRANEPQFTAVIEAKQKLDENSAKVVPTYRQEEANLLNKGAKEVGRASSHVLGGMRGKRKGAKDKVLSKQEAAKKKEEEERKTVVGNVNSKFAATQSLVKARLDGLDGPVGVLFDVAEMVARQKFEDKVDQLMSAYKDDRYSGVRGKLRWGWDKLTGMPKEVDQFYVEGTKVYIASMKEAFRNIAKFVDGQLAQAKNDIAEGKKKINDYLAGLKGKQKEWGDQAFTAIEGDFEALVSSVEDKKQGLASDLVQRYKKSREKLDERIDELKAENAGLLSKLVAFLKKVVAILKKLKDLAVLLMKVGGAVLRGIIKDPSGFLGNLVDAVKSGFSMFGENIGKHFKDALVGFVTGNLKDVGISASGESGPGGIGGVILQVLGLSPAQLKEKVAIKLGIRDPSVLEKAWAKVKTLFADGASALWGKIKETAGDIREKVESEMKEWIGFQIVKAGLKWIVSLFSPVSALLRAIKMIYDVMNFFVTNLDRIIDLVNGVLTSINAVVAGNIAAAAKFIENAAAKGLSLLLGFLASLLGLSGVGAKMQSIVQRVRTVVDRAVDRVLNTLLAPFRWVARKAAPLVARGKAAAKRAGAKVKTVAGKVAKFLFPRRGFSGGGENHTLYFAGDGENAQLMVASTPRSLLKYVTELRSRPENRRGTGKEALDRTGKHFAEIRNAQRDIRRAPAQAQKRIDKAMGAIAAILREILMRGDYATKSKPLPLVWTKPPSERYLPLYLGPVLTNPEKVIKQSTLKAAYEKGARMDARGSVADQLRTTNEAAIEAWEKKNMPIKEYLPHQRRKTPDGKHTIGLTPKFQVDVGKELKLPHIKPAPSPGGGLINDALKPFGYRPGAEFRDGDHVVELQIGGEDDLKNLWPLKADVNQQSGRDIRTQTFKLEGGVEISMGQLKEIARRTKNKRAVWLKISKTG